MGVFDGIDAERAQAIRDAVAKEVRHRIADELRESIRRQVESDVRARTEREVRREIEERAPTEAEREAFRAMVGEVRLDAYAQALLASDIADEAERRFQRGRRYANTATLALVVTLPILALGLSHALGGFGSATFAAVALTVIFGVAALVFHNARRDLQLGRRARDHLKIASEFLILAERAKAFAMVHAERTTSSEELHRILEGLRHDKERVDRTFDPSAHALAAARDSARARIEVDARGGARIDAGDVDVEAPEPPSAHSRRVVRR